MVEIAVSIITGMLTLAGTVITVVVSGRNQSKKYTAELEKNQAVMNAKMEELTREVREHNNFARRMPVLENEIKHINERLA